MRIKKPSASLQKDRRIKALDVRIKQELFHIYIKKKLEKKIKLIRLQTLAK